MDKELRQKRVAELLEGVRQTEPDLPYMRHVIQVYGFLTLRQIQQLVDGTVGGTDADCGSIHEFSGRPTPECRLHLRSNRCHHQLETSSNQITAGGVYYASVALLDTIPRTVTDETGEPVSRQRIIRNTRKLYDLDTPAYRAYTPYRDPDAPRVPLPLLQSYPTLRAAASPREIGAALDRLKDPYGEDMDRIKAALLEELAALLGPLDTNDAAV